MALTPALPQHKSIHMVAGVHRIVYIAIQGDGWFQTSSRKMHQYYNDRDALGGRRTTVIVNATNDLAAETVLTGTTER